MFPAHLLTAFNNQKKIYTDYVPQRVSLMIISSTFPATSDSGIFSRSYKTGIDRFLSFFSKRVHSAQSRRGMRGVSLTLYRLNTCTVSTLSQCCCKSLSWLVQILQPCLGKSRLNVPSSLILRPRSRPFAFVQSDQEL